MTGPNQLWEVDVKYGYITGEDRFFFLLSYIDVFDKNIIDYYMGLNCSAQDAVVTLKRALMRRDLYTRENKPVIRSDNGPLFISYLF
ncbi:DDE-type integrase/transposase/recombinase [Petroclostridium xylanilyticum]|uniref:DDE-type integrase/transposase/recombinase n=1 Tax=Petroclostridium xylanilyticum TaxID=1792311 RepID=UPI0012FF8043|nr:DDE-type integrase/transposase/recombinase [Petroclostridium xylanilyticum]